MSKTGIEKFQSELSKEEIQRVQEISKSIDLNDPNAVSKFGSDVQKKLGDFSDEILNNMRSSNAGEIGNHINQLLTEIYDAEDDGFLSKLPIVRTMVKSTKKLIAKYDTVQNNIDKISVKLDENRLSLYQDNEVLNGLFQKNVEYIKELAMYVTAAEEKLVELRKELEEIRKDPDADIYVVNKLETAMRNLDKKIVDMKLSGTIALGSLPQIQNMQENNTVLAQKIESSIQNTVPIWKNQIVMAINLEKQKKSAELQKRVTDATNRFLIKNAELTEHNTKEIAKQNERGVVEVSTLKEVNKRLINSVNELKNIKAKGDTNRREVERELKKIQDDIHKAFKDNI